MLNRLKENRQFPRIGLKVPVRYLVRGTPGVDNALCDNISAGGMSFTTDKFIPSSTHLMLEINVLSRILKPVGKVAWSSQLAHSDRNRLGIEFLEFVPSERNYLQDFIKMQLGQL